MKRIVYLLSFIILCGISMPAVAQFNFGVRGGANFSKIKVRDLKAKEATGWYLGPTVEFTVPVVGLGVEGSFLYSKVCTDVPDKTLGISYFSIPMNVKYKLYLPIVKPFVFGGPEYNVRISKSPKYLGHKLDTEASEWYMNLGVGVELFSKVQVALSWNWGLNDTFKDYNSKPRVIKLGGTIFF